MSLEDLIKNAKVVDIFEDLSEEQKNEADLLAHIAIAIHRKRRGLGMSQSEFASYVGVTQSMVSRWESADHNFTVKNLVALLTKLDLKLEIVPNVANKTATTSQKVVTFPLEHWSSGYSSQAMWG